VKVGDLVKTKVSLLDNRVPVGKVGVIAEIRNNRNKIIKVKFSDKTELYYYPESQLEVISEA
jgi:hypothetical protein